MKDFYPDPKKLWAMTPHEFNEWRANNDLPKLFDFLSEILPGFDRWLSLIPFGLDIVLRIVPSGDIFKGDTNKVVVRRNASFPTTTVFECFEGTADQAKEWWGARREEITVLGEIEPYFKWAKRVLGRDRFFVWDRVNSQVTEKFLYGSWSGLPEADCVTQAHLFRDFTVLKLGQIEVNRYIAIGARNLDFCNLDHLIISGNLHGYGSNWKTINYSSCRNLAFVDAEVAFYTFYSCAMNEFKALNSKLQDFYFEQSDIHDFRLDNSFIFRMGFTSSDITPYIRNCELREIHFKPKAGSAPAKIATTFRLLRAAYQSCGLRQEASECYYHERVFERKAYFHPYLSNSKQYQGILYGGRFSVLKHLYDTGLLQDSKLVREAWKVLISKIKMHTMPRYLLPLIRSRTRWAMSAVESLLWGYGERPSRILLVALALIGTYAGIYSAVDWIDEKGQAYRSDFWESAYFSVVTFTTLGYGDITPKTQLLRFLAASEALFGAFTIGLIVAGFSNRSRY